MNMRAVKSKNSSSGELCVFKLSESACMRTVSEKHHAICLGMRNVSDIPEIMSPHAHRSKCLRQAFKNVVFVYDRSDKDTGKEKDLAMLIRNLERCVFSVRPVLFFCNVRSKSKDVNFLSQ